MRENHMIIRKETEADFSRIYDLVKVAFQTAQVSNGKEQDFVDQLRSGPTYIPDLALVAEEDGALLGHIMLTETSIANGEGTHETLFLGPISVLLEHRRRGIGSRLIRESFMLAREMGYTSVVLVGDPAYYHRFGFRSSVDFGIRHAQEIPPEYVMACELVPGALSGVSGTFDC